MAMLLRPTASDAEHDPGGALTHPGAAAMHLVPEGVGSVRTWVFGLAKRGNELWAVGTFGILVKRPNAGWTEAQAPTAQVPLAIAFAPSGAGVVVGQEGAAWEVQPNSDKWTKVDTAESRRLFAVAASPSGEFVASGAFGALWYRPSGQAQWQRVTTKWTGFDGPHLYGVVFADDNQAVIVGERGSVLTLTHGEIADVSEHGEESLFAVSRCGASLVAAGQEGLVLVRDSSGWRSMHIDDNPDIFGLGCLKDNRVVAASAGFVEVAVPQASSPWDWQRWEPNPTRVGWYSTILSVNGDLLLAGQGDIWRTELVPQSASKKPE
jgi:hypothetical protein